MTFADLRAHFEKGTAHHAYVVRGAAVADIRRELATFGTMFVHEACMLSADDARMVRERAGRAAVAGRHIIVLAAQSCTEAAQNILLKTLEEPQPNTHIILAVPYSCSILDTVRSRCIELRCERPGEEDELLVALSYPKRKKRIEHMLKEDDASVRAAAYIERQLEAAHRAKSPAVATFSWALGLLRQPGTSAKLILEHLIATL